MRFSLLVAVVTVLWGCQQFGLDDGLPKRYGLKSGVIEYQLSGQRSGQETLFFDRYGMREARESQWEMSIMGIKQSGHTLALLLDGKTQYQIDLDSRTGTRSENETLEDIQANHEGKTAAEIGEEMMLQMGGKKIGTEDVEGKPCVVWEMANLGTKTWVWNGIALRTETNMMGMTFTIEATSIQTGIKIPAEKFEVPDDIDFDAQVQAEEALENMQDLIKSFKKP